MELDLYNKELKLAFEIQDSSHFQYIQFYHKTEEDFRKLQERDKLKKRLCQQQGVKLVCVDTRYIHPSFSDDQIWELIIEAIKAVKLFRKLSHASKKIMDDDFPLYSLIDEICNLSKMQLKDVKGIIDSGLGGIN